MADPAVMYTGRRRSDVSTSDLVGELGVRRGAVYDKGLRRRIGVYERNGKQEEAEVDGEWREGKKERNNDHVGE